MRKIFASALAACCLIAVAAMAQTPAPQPGRGRAPLQVPNPSYQTVTATVEVNAPVAQAWERVGKFCDIGEWGGFGACQLLSGTDGELGAVRSVGNEILVGKTQYSYTYTQPVREGAVYNLYHGTLEARATGPGTTQLIYSLVWDNSMLAEDARAANIESRRSSATRWLANMKIITEGGTIPPPAPPAGRAN